MNRRSDLPFSQNMRTAIQNFGYLKIVFRLNALVSERKFVVHARFTALNISLKNIEYFRSIKAEDA